MGEIIQSTQSTLAEANITRFQFTNRVQNTAEINRVLEEFHTVDNDKLLIRITSCP